MTREAVGYDADFRADWLSIMRDLLEESGVAYDANLTDEQVSFVFWNNMLRRVDAKRRKVQRAKELRCPASLEAGLAALAGKFESGQDVSAHLNRQRVDTEDASFHDGLLNDWYIHHFHLEPLGDRSQDCLFAVVKDDAVYCLALLPPGAHAEVELVQRIHDNWPQLLERVKTSLPAASTPPDATSIKKSRKDGGSALVQVADGTVYRSLGGGGASARIGGSIVHHSDNAFDKVNGWQKWFDREAAERLPAMLAKGMVFGDPPTFQLAIEPGNTFCVVEHSAQVKIPLGKLS